MIFSVLSLIVKSLDLEMNMVKKTAAKIMKWRLNQ